MCYVQGAKDARSLSARAIHKMREMMKKEPTCPCKATHGELKLRSKRLRGLLSGRPMGILHTFVRELLHSSAVTEPR